VRQIDLGEGAWLELHEAWLPDAPSLLRALLDEVPWEARAIKLFGRSVLQPRLVAWLGEPEAVYTYSGVRNEPRPLTPAVAALRARLARELGLPFNGVLCNLYRDGSDAMGLHSDSEPELGPDPVVASVSLGAERRFVLRHKRGSARGKLDLLLPSGSLLVMRGTTQRTYRHGIPRVRTPIGPRVNLTFRHVQPWREA
jgi:alkylated DNA repair dioxygenase AlkB